MRGLGFANASSILTAEMVTRILPGPDLFRTLAFGLSVLAPMSAAHAEPVSLGDAIERTLSLSPAVQVQRVQVEGAQGDVRTARGAYDWAATVSYGEAFNKTPDFSSTTFKETEDVVGSRSVSAGVGKAFRNGVQVDLSNTLETTRDKSVAPLGTVGQNTVALSVTIPLLKGFGTKAATATERAAQRTLEATRFTSGQEIASEIYNLAVLYWRSRALDQNTMILEETFGRARNTATVLKERLDRGLMAPVEYQRSLAELQLREIDVDEGRQQAHAGRSKLAAQMGQADQTALPTAASAFPDPAPIAAMPPQNASGLTDYALAHRLDVKALEQQILVARINLYSAGDATRPQFDLNLTQSYKAARARYEHNEYEKFFYGSERSPSTSVMLTWSYPLGNNAALGKVTSRRAAYKKLEFDLTNLRNAISSEVAIAFEKLRSSRLAYDKAVSSQKVMQEVADVTMSKLNRGEATMTDLISVENRLAEARLKVIDSQSNYAQALAELRFVTGLLVEGVDEKVTVDPAVLLSLPAVAPQ